MVVVIFWFNEINNAKDLIKNNLYKHRVGRPEPKLPLSTLCMMKFLKVRSFWRNQLLLLAKTVIHLQQWICALPSDLSSVLFYSFKHYRVALNSYGQKADTYYINGPMVSFSSCQRNLIKTFQIEGMIALITKMTLIFSSDL